MVRPKERTSRKSSISRCGHSGTLGKPMVAIYERISRVKFWLTTRQYTDAEDTLGIFLLILKLFVHMLTMSIDPDDLINPRTATRVGPKFQANIGPVPDRDNISPLGASSDVFSPFLG